MSDEHIQRLSIAEHYHEQTKYSEEGLGDLPPVDFSRQPRPYKEIHSELRVNLVPFLDSSSYPVAWEKSKKASSYSVDDSPLARLSRSLYFSNGATGMMRTPQGVHLFRAAPSAGALYPTEIYVFLRETVAMEGLLGVAPGIYNYSVRDHHLVPVFEGDYFEELERITFGHPAVARSSAVVVMTGNYSRGDWRYMERCYRRILLDTGHILGNLTSFVPLEGMAAIPIAGFMDQDLANLMFLDTSDENPLLVVPLITEDDWVEVSDEAPRIQKSPILPVPEIQGASTLFSEYHRATFIDHEDPVTPEGPLDIGRHASRTPIQLGTESSDPGRDLPSVIVGRRSARAFTGEPMSLETLGRILAYGYEPHRNPGSAVLQVPECLETFVLSFSIDELSRGVYYYTSQSGELHLVREGDFRFEAQHSCLGQELAATASAMIVHVADLRSCVRTYGDRVYRYLHTDAGVIGERLQLAAIHEKGGASGIGGFFDEELCEMLQIPAEDAILYVTLLGRTESDPTS